MNLRDFVHQLLEISKVDTKGLHAGLEKSVSKQLRNSNDVQEMWPSQKQSSLCITLSRKYRLFPLMS